MRKKKKKWIAVAAVLLFFAVSGLFYYLASVPENPVSENPDENGTTVEKDTGISSGYTGASTDGTASGLPPGDTEDAPNRVFVFLCGQVASEGVYELPEGARLYEALALAGGYTEEADTAYHNLARMVSDGERIYVPSKEETKDRSLEEKLENPGMETAGDIKQNAVAGEIPGQMQKVNLNKADIETLMTLPGIGQAKAESIIEYRTKVGMFVSIEEVMNISGIGESMFEKMKEYITVE